MSDDLERELRQALRRKQPPRDLTPRVRWDRRVWAIAAAGLIAALVPAGVGGYHRYEEHQAKDQIVFAMRLTATKLHRTEVMLKSMHAERNR